MATAAAASAPAWKQFSFFDVVPVKDTHDLGSPPDIFKNTPEISTVASSSAGVLVADIHGSVHLLNKDFESVRSWVAHVGGRVTHMVVRKGILISLGEEDAIRSPLIKIWDLQNIDKKTAAPLLLRSTKIQPSNRPHPVSTVALSATLSHLAIGLGDGTVLLYRHLDQSLASTSTITSSSLTSLPKPKTVHESPTEPITGLEFREPTDDSPHLSLFVVTTNRVLVYQASGRGSGGPATVVDEVGCGLGCVTMDWKKREVVIARDEAIYSCGPEGRGACYAHEGHKSSIHTHLNYLVIVSPPLVPTASAASFTIRNIAVARGASLDSEVTKLTIFDPENKLIAYSGAFNEGVREVISQGGQMYILGNDGTLSHLAEKPTSAKLDMLYRKSLYLLALNLAKTTTSMDEESVAEIHRQYGDHLYSKADYDGAMKQFVKTIGHVQPSYVIRKFLDAQRIHNLVTYLQELHSLGLANSDHTTLLLNTYTKLKDVARLDSFIKTESRSHSDSSNDELPFDLETAIRVCRQAGYFEHASYLAKKYDRHEDYLRIQIEDAGNYKDALAYLRHLGSETAETNLARYGRAMLTSLPQETTQLLIDLCTNSGGSLDIEQEEQSTAAIAKQSAAAPSYLSYLALNRNNPIVAVPSEHMITAATITGITTSTTTPPSPSIKTVRPGDATVSRRDSGVFDGSRPTTPPAAPSIVKAPRPKVKKLSPRIYFAHFVDHMEHFLVFLETVAMRRWGQTVDEDVAATLKHVSTDEDDEGELPEDAEADKIDQVSVWNTLLELYLTLGSTEEQAPTTKALRAKAMRLLQSDTIPYDPTHALILCSSRGYTQGLVLLWERTGMHEDVLRFWMDKAKLAPHNGDDPDDASTQVVNHLNAYGPTRPHLYPLVLRFLTSTPQLLAKHRADLTAILAHIDSEGIMPPLGVIQVLSRNDAASVGLVKEWLMMRIKDARDEIQRDEELTNSYRTETKEKLRLVGQLSDVNAPHVFHVTRCSACSGSLDLPSVHFMCDHSYHQRCLSEHDTECTLCARKHGVIREIRSNNQRLAEQHDVFLSEVQESGFKAIAASFGRGVLNRARLDVEPI